MKKKESIVSPKFSPHPFWSWNEKMNPTELKRQIDEMKKAGYGGFFMHSRVGLVTKYLSDEWFSLIREPSVYAYSVGLDAYIYDEDMWPSGYAGGEVVRRRPDLRHCVLACVSNERLDPEDEIAVGKYRLR